MLSDIADNFKGYRLEMVLLHILLELKSTMFLLRMNLFKFMKTTGIHYRNVEKSLFKSNLDIENTSNLQIVLQRK